jgi:hypothetical protein
MGKLGPEFWGPPAWKFLHIVALAYPEKPNDYDKQAYKNFYTIIKDILPCKVCGEHYNQHLKNHPLDDNILSSKDNLVNWTIDIHNEVNKLNNKTVYDYDKARELITQPYYKSNNMLYLFIGIVIGVLLFKGISLLKFNGK